MHDRDRSAACQNQNSSYIKSRQGVANGNGRGVCLHRTHGRHDLADVHQLCLNK